MFKLYTILQGLFFCIVLAGQQPVFTHQQRFKVEDGLPQNFISGIVQDKEGFLWIGTRDGLARYDGRHFIIFRQQYNDSNSLSSSVITSLLIDKRNLVWILYDNNYVDCFDPRTLHIVKRIDRNSTAAKLNEKFVGPDFYLFNNEWFILPRAPRKGIAVFDFDKNRHYLYNRSNGYLSSDTVMAFTHDSSGNLWMVSPAGLQTADKHRAKFRTIPFPASIKLKYDSLLRAVIAYDPKGELIIADEEKFVIYNPGKQSFRMVKLPTRLKDKRYIQLDAAGACYFVYNAQLFKLQGDSFVNLWKSPLSDKFPSTGFFIDRSNVFWYATNAGGLIKVDLNGFPVSSFPYQYNFYVDVLRIDGISPKDLPVQSLKEKWAYHFRYMYDAAGEVFFTLYNHGNYNRIYYWQAGKILSLPFPAGKQVVFNGIDFDSSENIWAVDDLNKGLWHWKDKESMPSFTEIRSDEYKAAYRFADLLIVDGDFWISSEESGLYQMRNGVIINRFYQHSKASALSSDMLGELCRDPFDPKKFWIGSLGGGLMLWNTRTGLEKVFTTADGLPNNTIYGIVSDEDGNLWLSTNNGLCRFNIKDHTTRLFNTSDGLPGAEFNRFHHFKFSDGRIAFGGLEGYAVFNPSDLKKINTDLQIQLTRVEVNNVPQEFSSKNKFIKSPLAELKQIDLSYDKNNLAVEFAALFFNDAEKIHYRYMLKGADKGWIENGNENVARYTNLRPGNYKLLIKASNAPGEWSANVKEIAVHVSPPPWKSWWAYTIYIMILAVTVAWYWRYRERMIHMKEQITFEHREAARLREIDEFKDRFFNNITHEFRTPLSLIIAPVEKLYNDPDLPGSTRKILSGINRNAGQLLNLINQLLDLSKLEAGKMPMNLSSGDLVDFVTRCMEPFRSPALEKNITMKFFAKEVQGYFLFDHEKLEKIIFNLLSNAVKFTTGPGEINLTLEKTEDKYGQSRLMLYVKDTGIGISKDNLPRVFERFYQEDSGITRHYPGTGIGLSLVKELTELMQGSVEVESEPKRGTTFTVNLPIQQANIKYNPETGTGPDVTGNVEIDNGGVHSAKAPPLILIAEDNPELCNFLVDSLSANWHVISATDGGVAWDKILEELPEIVVSDAMMPVRDGFELCSLVKKDNRTAHIGFIMLTAKAAHRSKMEGLEAGADEYLTKPFHLDELKARIGNLLQHQEKIREHLQQQLLPGTPMPALPHVNDVFIRQLYETIDEKLDDPKLDVEFLSRAMAMSRSTLNRKLNALVGVSANELIRRYRLQKAAALLAAGHDVTETAYTVGFNTVSYFSECFKRQYGRSPSEFGASKAI